MFVNFDVRHSDFLCSPVLIALFVAFKTGCIKSRWLACWHAAPSCCWTDHSELRLSSIRVDFCFVLNGKSLSFSPLLYFTLPKVSVFNYINKLPCFYVFWVFSTGILEVLGTT